jgi:hypothetical protein
MDDTDKMVDYLQNTKITTFKVEVRKIATKLIVFPLYHKICPS